MFTHSSKFKGKIQKIPRIVILGGGYGGVYTARGLRKAARNGLIHLSVISRDNFFLSQPLLSQVVSGSIEPPHIVSPLRKVCPEAEFHQADIENVDMRQKEVVIRYQEKPDFLYIPFDHLIISVGGSTALSWSPGVAAHLAETNVILLQGSNRILPELDEGLAYFSQQVLERKGIQIRLNTRIVGATAEGVTLDDGTDISAKTLVAAIGSSGNRLLEKLPCQKDHRGRLIVDSRLSVVGHSGLWAVGDCAAIPDIRNGGNCQPTAQCAMRGGSHLAKNLLATITGKSGKPFAYKCAGVFVPLGRFSGAARIMGVNISGFWAWWLYRTFFLFQLPGLKRKMQVLIDWSLELVFHRDIVKLDITKSHQTTYSHYSQGQKVFSQGDLASGFFIILRGQVAVIRETGGIYESVATLGPGEYFGEMSLLYGVRHTATIQAISAVDVVQMNGTDFTTLVNSSFDFKELFSGVMRERLSGLGVEIPHELSEPTTDGHLDDTKG